MHGCARGPPPEGRWGGMSNPPLIVREIGNIFRNLHELQHKLQKNCNLQCEFRKTKPPIIQYYYKIITNICLTSIFIKIADVISQIMDITSL